MRVPLSPSRAALVFNSFSSHDQPLFCKGVSNACAGIRIFRWLDVLSKLNRVVREGWPTKPARAAHSTYPGCPVRARNSASAKLKSLEILRESSPRHNQRPPIFPVWQIRKKLCDLRGFWIEDTVIDQKIRDCWTCPEFILGVTQMADKRHIEQITWTEANANSICARPHAVCNRGLILYRAIQRRYRHWVQSVTPGYICKVGQRVASPIDQWDSALQVAQFQEKR